MVKIKGNGTLKTVAIIVGILLAAGGIVWSLAIQSGNLNRVVIDVTKVESEVTKTNSRVKKMEEAVILIQSDIGYIQRDVAKILVKVESE